MPWKLNCTHFRSSHLAFGNDKPPYPSSIILSSGTSTAIMAAEPQWGVTPPISMTLPNESEKRANDALFAELKAQNTYEHATETAKR